MKLLSLFTLLTTLFLTLVSSQNSCSGDCWVHDPAVIRRTSDGLYFRFSTGHRIQIATATSLSGPWTIRGSALPSGSSINLPGRGDLWAPDIAQVGNYYYLYYSVSTFGSQNSAVGVARSTTMDVGSWTDLGATNIRSSPGSAYNAIDGNLINAGGNYFMTFGSFWGDLYQVQMNNPPTTTNGGTPWQVAFNSSGSHAVEGPTIYYRSPYYYLFFSSGICCGYDGTRPAQGAEYRINVCRSTSATGGYVDKTGRACTQNGGSSVLASGGTRYGPGGQGVFADANSGGAILYYHYVDTRVGYADGQKRFGWNVLNWSGGWPSV